MSKVEDLDLYYCFFIGCKVEDLEIPVIPAVISKSSEVIPVPEPIPTLRPSVLPTFTRKLPKRGKPRPVRKKLPPFFGKRLCCKPLKTISTVRDWENLPPLNPRDSLFWESDSD